MDNLFEQLRRDEFSRLDAEGHLYLDYTGAGLYSESQVRAHTEMLTREVLGNPHSQNPTSLAATRKVEQARERVREFFDASPDEYEVIFTLNASGALKLIGESYPFGPGGRYVLVADNHNSVNGIREFALAKGAEVHYALLNHELRIDDITQHLEGIDLSQPNLFSYPAQSNFSGVKHPLEWITEAKALGYDVLLDTAAYAPTNRISLREIKPDYITLSFYKMFGFPTGVGALVARREALSKLRRPWFGGGTVRFVSAQNQVYLLQPTGEAFEDGTLNFLSIAAVTDGLDFLDRVGIENITRHVSRLTGLLLDGLLGLQHANGLPVVRLYGPKTNEQRGGTVAFNVIALDGEDIDSKIVEMRANARKISIRTGCFCNPGAAEAAFNYEAVSAYECFNLLDPAEFALQQFSACMNDQPVGAVRVSLGIASTEDDVRRFLDFMQTFRDFEPPVDHAREVPEYVGN